MKLSEARALFQELTQTYFSGATVVYANQSRAAKTGNPLVVISTGPVHRPLSPSYKTVDGVMVGHYLSRISLQVDLFTNGAPLTDEKDVVYAYENTAEDDMLAFVNFLDSPYVIGWCHDNDVSIVVDGDVQDLTGVVNDNNYEFRARVSIMYYFTQKVIGHAGMLKESSILYPRLENEEGGSRRVVYGPEVPGQKEDLDTVVTLSGETYGVVVDSVFEKTPSGGGLEELADKETGYFTNIEIEEEGT